MAGKLGSVLAWPRASAGIWGPLERREQLWLSQSVGAGRGGTDRRTDTVSSLLRLRSSLAAAGASPGCAERLSLTCPGASTAVVGGWGHWGHPGQGHPHTSSCLSQVPPSDRMTPFPNPRRGLARRGRRGGQRCWASPSMSRRSWVSLGDKGGIFRVWTRCPGSVCLGSVRLPWDHAGFVSPCSQVSGTAGKPRDTLMLMGEGRRGAGAARRRSSC